MAYVNNSVYWIGNDGNIWLKGPGGAVKNMGAAIYPAATANSYAGAGGKGGATRIENPSNAAPAAAAPTNPNGGGSGTTTADKSNDIALQLAGIGALESQQSSGLGAVDTALGRLTGQYDTEAGANEKTYTDQSNTNQTSLQRNKQSSYIGAAQGRQGLFGSLASVGALNGDGITLANRAVQQGANADLTGAAENYSTNQAGLDTSIGTFRQEDKLRRDNANTAAEDARTGVKNETAKSRMSFLTNLSNDYAAQGDAGNAKRYSEEAAALYPTLASTSIPSSNIAYTGAAFTPGSLSNYMAGANGSVVSTTPTQPGQTIPGLVATTKKKQLQTV